MSINDKYNLNCATVCYNQIYNVPNLYRIFKFKSISEINIGDTLSVYLDKTVLYNHLLSSLIKYNIETKIYEFVDNGEYSEINTNMHQLSFSINKMYNEECLNKSIVVTYETYEPVTKIDFNHNKYISNLLLSDSAIKNDDNTYSTITKCILHNAPNYLCNLNVENYEAFINDVKEIEITSNTNSYVIPNHLIEHVMTSDLLFDNYFVGKNINVKLTYYDYKNATKQKIILYYRDYFDNLNDDRDYIEFKYTPLVKKYVKLSNPLMINFRDRFKTDVNFYVFSSMPLTFIEMTFYDLNFKHVINSTSKKTIESYLQTNYNHSKYNENKYFYLVKLDIDKLYKSLEYSYDSVSFIVSCDNDNALLYTNKYSKFVFNKCGDMYEL